jgi:predicted RND superfamily exporter protein
LEDPDKRQWIKSLRDWSPPAIPLEMDSIPDTLLRNFQAKDDSGRFLIAIYPNGERKNGKISMAFTRELFDLQLHPDLSGPLGETPVFAEILWLVTSEGPRLTLFALLGIFVLVFLNQLSLRGTAWIMMPLLTGMALTFGLMAVLNFKLNFFNIVVIPSLLGMGVDAGVHYYRRWHELGKDTHKTQQELFGPLTVATVTTMCGYSGMIFARHPGLHSIGLLACLGLGCTWVTSLVLLPGVLEWRQKRGKDSRL